MVFYKRKCYKYAAISASDIIFCSIWTIKANEYCQKTVKQSLKKLVSTYVVTMATAVV